MESKTETLVSVDDLIGKRRWTHLREPGMPVALCGCTVHGPFQKHTGVARVDHCPDCIRIRNELWGL